MRRFFFCLSVAALGCGSDPTPAVDASTDAAADVTVDVASDVATCDVGAAPAATLPMLRSTLLFLGGDAGVTAPTPSGGDPSGRWVMTAATVYLPATAVGQVSLTGSSVTGTGWGVIEGSSYRINTTLELVLDTTQIGTVRRPVGTTSRGTFMQRGGALDLTPACSTGATAGAMQMLGFSRDAMDRGRLHADITGAMGRFVIVFDLERVP